VAPWGYGLRKKKGYAEGTLPYSNKADKAAQMRRYRARKRTERQAREAQRNFIRGCTPSSAMAAPVRQAAVPSRPSVSIQPRPAPKAESFSSVLSAARRVMDGNSTAIVTDAPTRARYRYKRIIDIPAELLAKHGITRQGNILNAGPGVDIQKVLRMYVL